MNIITVWSKVIQNSDRLKQSIKDIDFQQDDLNNLIKYTQEYFENVKKFKNLISNKDDNNQYKIYNEYLEVNLGIIGNEFMNIKEKNIDLYNTLINSIEELHIKELEYYNKKLIEDYTPYDIHRLKGKKDEEYNGWY